MAGRERLVFRVETRAIPNFFCSYRRTSATGCHLNAPPDYSCNPQSNQHRQKDPRPFLTAAPPGDARQKQTECEVSRPIAESACFAHEMERQPALPFLLFQFFKLLRRQRRFHPMDELIMGLFQLIFPRRFILPFVLLAKLIFFLLSRQDKSMDFRCLICSDVKLFCTTGDQR